MVIFNDKHVHAIDQRSRLQLPRDIRSRLKIKKGDLIHLLFTPATPPYLEVRTDEQWKAYEQRLMALPAGGDKRKMKRFIETVHETAPADNQGRFVISQRFRDICGLDREVVVVNMSTCIEVWKKESFELQYPEMLRSYNDNRDQLF